jgi:hypothetical protein
MKVESMDEDAVNAAIIERLKAQQIPADLLPLATAYQIRLKGADDTGQNNLVKKKFIVSQANHLLSQTEEGS